MTQKRILNENKGFTIVELIVVLVILAILAAILVPALLGYIDEAKTKNDIINAKTCMTAIQSQLTKEYGKSISMFSGFGDTDAEKDILLYKNNDNENYKKFVNNVFDLAGIDKPDILIFYTLTVTKADINAGNIKNRHNAFNIISLVYLKDNNSLPVYYNFVTQEWKEGSPYSDDLILRSENKIQLGDLTGKKVRIWVLCNKNDKTITQLNNILMSKVNYTSGINTKGYDKNESYE